MNAIAVGASGYSYNDWVGPVYPEGTKPDAMLAHYAGRFDAVELNFTYYRMPTAGALAKLAATAATINPGFVFAIKAHRTLTHEIGPAWRDDADAFAEALTGLAVVPAPALPLSAGTADGVEADAFVPSVGLATRPETDTGRLSAVLAQFPFSFHYTIQNRRHLAALLDRWEALPVAVEFRNAEWLRDPVVDELTRRDVALVGVDEPELAGLLPGKVWTTSTRLAYVRFHGRNAANWWQGDNASRYDYLYSENELKEWLPRLAELMRFSRRTVAFFNNHWKGKAVKNAAMMAALLRGIGKDDGDAP